MAGCRTDTIDGSQGLMISKSDYLKFRVHPAFLWLARHRPSILPKPDESALQRIVDGKALEPLVESLFGLPSESGLTPGSVHFQYRFQANGFYCISDIVEVDAACALTISEIKSATKAKDKHFDDLAFQWIVAELAGHNVARVQVIHQSGGYRLEGELDPAGLFEIEDVTEAVSKILADTKRDMAAAQSVVDVPVDEATANTQTEPDLSPRFCGSTKAIKEWCEVLRELRDIPDGSIYDLPYATPKLIGQLEDMGVTRIADIPEGFTLRPEQIARRESLRRAEPYVDADAIRTFLHKLEYPLYFLDYEAISLPIPVFQGTGPFQQVPFQFSLHVEPAPGADLLHHEFLHDLPTMPIPDLVEALRNAMEDKGSVVVWFQPYEKTRNAEMAEFVPHLSEFLQGLNGRVIDLMEPFKKRLYDDARFGGSASIKNVLPVLVPDLSYKGLTVQNGDAAALAWRQAILEGKLQSHEVANTLNQLRAYCTLDTIAMVKVLEFLKRVLTS